MATLTGNTIASTYTGLLSVTGAVGADTVEAVTDGAGTSTSLSLSQQRATITLGSGAADDFIVDGTTLVVEGDNNRVGIGTASPATTLDVTGTLGVTGNSTLTGDVSIVSASSASPTLLVKNTNDDGEPSYIQFIKDTSNSAADNDEIVKMEFYHDNDANSLVRYGAMIVSTPDVSNGSEDTKIKFMTRLNGTDTETLTLNSGKVGIGVSAPAEMLEIYHASSPAIQLNDGGDYQGIIRLAGNDLEIRGSSGTMEFYNGSADGDSSTLAMTIDSSQKVGIGTTSPASLLHIESDSADPTLRITNKTAAAINTGPDIEFWNNPFTGSTSNAYESGAIRVRKTSGTDNNHDHYMSFETRKNSPEGINEHMRIVSGGGINIGSGVLTSASANGSIVVDEGIYIGTYNGDNQIRSSSAGGGSATLYIGNAAIQVSSDERLKTNIVDTSISALNKINQVRVVDFNWNDPSDISYNNRNARGLWTGVIAQEIVDVFPFAVNAPRNEEDLSVDSNSESIWQVDQSHLVPVLIKALQEADDKIDALTARIEALEA